MPVYRGTPELKKVPLPDREAIVAARKGGGNMQFVKANVPVLKLAQGMDRRAIPDAEVVTHRYGVTIDARPTNPAWRPLSESGQALPTPCFIKNKTLTELDPLLGAKGTPAAVGH
ncbi:MAG: hypothetical protein ACP5U2_12580 [Bryobacteraceae bacterium]